MSVSTARTFTVYAIQCVKNKKVYVGCTKNFDVRISAHFSELRSGMKTRYDKSAKSRVKSEWQKDYDLYGKGAFEVYVLEMGLPQEKAQKCEAFWINYYDARNPESGYNTSSSAVPRHLDSTDQVAPKFGVPFRRTSNLSQKPQERQPSDTQQGEVV